MINVAIVSDIRLYREGVSRILNEVDYIKINGVSSNDKETVDLLTVNSVDLVLIDMRIPDSHSSVASIIENYPDTKIIVIAVPEDDDNYLFCVESGVTGYLSKESSIEELVNAVKTVGDGGTYCSSLITEYIVRCVRNKKCGTKIKDARVNDPGHINNLTQREKQIVKYLAAGMSNKKIAKTLTIELSTVKNHVHNILIKMGVDSRTQVAYMLRDYVYAQKNRSLDLDLQLDHL